MSAAALRSRADLATARRLVVKIGSSSLTRPDGQLNVARVEALVGTLAQRCAAGTQIVLVSSGAIAAGIAPLGLTRRPTDLATAQAAASVGQGLLVARYAQQFAQHGITVGQVLFTVDDVVRRDHYRNAHRTLTRLLELGVVPIVNENDTVATDEIRFGDNDRLAAFVSHMVHADALILLTDVDALYDGPPSRPGAQRIATVTGPADLADILVTGRGSTVGTGGMVTKVDAARIAAASGIPVVVTSADLIAQALTGDDVGTWFAATGRRTATRLLWLEHAAKARGRLILDDGAVRAVVVGRKSLLPAGVTAVEGNFEAHDPVDLVDANGVVVARGLVAFAAAHIPAMLGRGTAEISDDLGAPYGRHLIHRDDLAVLPNATAPR